MGTFNIVINPRADDVMAAFRFCIPDVRVRFPVCPLLHQKCDDLEKLNIDKKMKENIANIIKRGTNGEDITIDGRIVQCSINYDNNLLQIRCTKCFSEVTKGQCQQHPTDSPVCCISSVYFILQDSNGETVTVYPSVSFWANIDLAFRLDLIKTKEAMEKINNDAYSFRNKIMNIFLWKNVTIRAKVVLREDAQDATSKYISLRAYDVNLLPIDFDLDNSELQECEEILKTIKN